MSKTHRPPQRLGARRCSSETCSESPRAPSPRRRSRVLAGRAAAAGLDGIDVNADPGGYLDADTVAFVHKKGLDVVTWVVPLFHENALLFSTLAAAGVDGFTSDLPPALLAWDAAARRQGDVSDRR